MGGLVAIRVDVIYGRGGTYRTARLRRELVETVGGLMCYMAIVAKRIRRRMSLPGCLHNPEK